MSTRQPPSVRIRVDAWTAAARSDNIAAMYPVILEIGPLRVYSFGLMMAIAFMTAAYLTGRELARKGYDGDIASTLVVWAAVGGIAGARLWVILDDWSGFVADPFGAIFTGAGFTWYGGLFGGLLAVTIAMRRNGIPWFVGADSIAPGLILAHGIGRIGCQLAGDGDWGTVTTVPWGMAYPNAIVGWDYPPGVVVHPTPLYEFFAYSAGFLLMWNLRTRNLATGSMFWLFLILSPFARFWIEFVRINPIIAWGLSEAQLTSIALMAIGAINLLRARSRVHAAA